MKITRLFISISSLLGILIFQGCGKKASFTKINKVEIVEDATSPILAMPNKIQITNNRVYFLNYMSSLFQYDINTGEKLSEISIGDDRNILYYRAKMLTKSDSSLFLDNPYLKNMKNIELYGFDIFQDDIYLYYYRMLPVVLDYKMSVEVKPFIVRYDDHFINPDIYTLEDDLYEDILVGINADEGFLYKKDYFYSSGSYYDDSIKNINLCSIRMVLNSDSTYYLDKVFNYPFPAHVLENPANGHASASRTITKLGQHYFTDNCKDIFRLNDGERILKLPEKLNDSLLRLKSYCLIPDETDEIKYIVYQEERAYKSVAFGSSKKYLVLYDYKRKKVLDRIAIGQSVGTLSAKGDTIYFLKIEDEKYFLYSYKISEK